MRIALGISYDGTDYHGWQIQVNSPSIQSLVTTAVAKVADHEVKIICAGRTDKGVHAMGQVVHFDTEAVRDMRAWVLGVNTHLPKDIRILWAKIVDANFHARFSATARAYRYVIYNAPVASALLRNQTTWHHQLLDETRMAEAAIHLIGKHDFTSYRALQCQAHSPVRTVHKLEITRKEKFIFIDIQANAFLHHMVRNIAGVLMAIGVGKHDPIWAKEVLHAKNRAVGEITAPARGLYFMQVFYPEQFKLTENSDFSGVKDLLSIL